MTLPLSDVKNEAPSTVLKLAKDYNEDLISLKSGWNKYLVPICAEAALLASGLTLFQSTVVAALLATAFTSLLLLVALWIPDAATPAYVYRSPFFAAYIASLHGRNPLPIELVSDDAVEWRQLLKTRHDELVLKAIPSALFLDVLVVDGLAFLMSRRVGSSGTVETFLDQFRRLPNQHQEEILKELAKQK
jgi:hypothetical protein